MVGLVSVGAGAGLILGVSTVSGLELAVIFVMLVLDVFGLFDIVLLSLIW